MRHRESRLAILIVLIAALVAACSPDPLRTVDVDFELQLINANATSWGFGIDGGPGEGGFGGVNETKSGTVSAKIGDPVFCKAFAEHWDSSDPAHQMICRILVDNEEIYLCADQGSPGADTSIECGGPVYLPDDESD